MAHDQILLFWTHDDGRRTCKLAYDRLKLIALWYEAQQNKVVFVV